jgi:serine/threonine protein phosphatase PrpC
VDTQEIGPPKAVLSRGKKVDMGLEHGGRSLTGASRAVNQDSYYANGNLGLFVVADGAGGMDNGDVASRLAVFEVRSRFSKDKPETMADRRETLIAGIQSANLEIRKWVKSTGERRMASTIVAVAADGPRCVIAHVGDSRCYRLRDGKVTRLTDDHTVAAELARNTGLTDEEARKLPFNNVLSRALGSREKVDVSINEEHLDWGDILLLCSDGISGAFTDEELGRVMSHCTADLNEAASELVAEARQRIGDDVTCLLLKWGTTATWRGVRVRTRKA